MTTHIVRHPNVQNHLLLAKRIESMARGYLAKNQPKKKDDGAIDTTYDSLIEQAREHRRKAFLNKNKTFIFM